MFHPVPRFRQRNGTVEIQNVKGLRVEIFSRLCEKNTTRPLMGWIVGTGRNAIYSDLLPTLSLLFIGSLRRLSLIVHNALNTLADLLDLCDILFQRSIIAAQTCSFSN